MDIGSLLNIREKIEEDDERCVCGCLIFSKSIFKDEKEFIIKGCSNNECNYSINSNKEKYV